MRIAFCIRQRGGDVGGVHSLARDIARWGVDTVDSMLETSEMDCNGVCPIVTNPLYQTGNAVRHIRGISAHSGAALELQKFSRLQSGQKNVPYSRGFCGQPADEARHVRLAATPRIALHI